MTKTLTLRSFDLPAIHKFGIGFDNLFDDLMRVNAQQSNNNYPPYDIVQVNDDEYMISVAVAGFGPDNLTVTKEKKTLIIEGKHSRETVNDEDNPAKYLHKGISERSFRREFQLADYVEISNAHLQDLSVAVAHHATVGRIDVKKNTLGAQNPVACVGAINRFFSVFGTTVSPDQIRRHHDRCQNDKKADCHIGPRERDTFQVQHSVDANRK